MEAFSHAFSHASRLESRPDSPTPSSEENLSKSYSCSSSSSKSKRSREKDELEDRYPSENVKEDEDEEDRDFGSLCDRIAMGKFGMIKSSPRSVINRDSSFDFVCDNCGERYNDSDNSLDSCYWLSSSHKGRFVVNKKSDVWDDWDSSTMGNPNSHFCRSRFGMEGGFEWTICGCDNNGNECTRIGQHKPEGAAESDDDFEVCSSEDED